jgi:quercetin dioxygenase-like cupin family protein
LYFPSGVDQTFHTHPSLRVGIIVSGRGIAEYYEGIILKTTRLNPGDSFVLDRHTRHRFRTEDSIMSIIAFHPDSEDGPRDEYNPMKARTYIK